MEWDEDFFWERIRNKLVPTTSGEGKGMDYRMASRASFYSFYFICFVFTYLYSIPTYLHTLTHSLSLSPRPSIK